MVLFCIHSIRNVRSRASKVLPNMAELCRILVMFKKPVHKLRKNADDYVLEIMQWHDVPEAAAVWDTELAATNRATGLPNGEVYVAAEKIMKKQYQNEYHRPHDRRQLPHTWYYVVTISRMMNDAMSKALNGTILNCMMARSNFLNDHHVPGVDRPVLHRQ